MGEKDGPDVVAGGMLVSLVDIYTLSLRRLSLSLAYAPKWNNCFLLPLPPPSPGAAPASLSLLCL